MLDQLRRRFIQHPWRHTTRCCFMVDAVDTATTNVFVQFVLLNHTSQVRSFANPIAFLNDPSVDVDQVQTSVGARRTIDRTKIRVVQR